MRQERRHGENAKPWKLWLFIILVALVVCGFFVYQYNKGTGIDYSQYNYNDSVYSAPNATTVMEEYSDFECPYCQAFAPTIRAIRDAYKDKVRVVFKEFPLRTVHPEAELAAEAAECAREQNRFWAFHDVLFESKLIDKRSLGLHAQGLGLDMKEWQSCMDIGRPIAHIDQDILDGQAAGVRGTPTLFVNGVESSSRTVQELEAQIR